MKIINSDESPKVQKLVAVHTYVRVCACAHTHFLSKSSEYAIFSAKIPTLNISTERCV